MRHRPPVMTAVLLFILAFATCLAGFGAASAHAQVSDAVRERIDAAVPDEPYAKPQAKRRVLVCTITRGFRHRSIAVGVAAMQRLGQKTGAFEIVHTESLDPFEKDTLNTFDAVLLLNTTGEIFLPRGGGNDEDRERAKRLQANLLEFVEGGKGLVGIHAATDTLYRWPEFGKLIGGYFDGHPWNANSRVTLKLDDKQHPLTSMFTEDDLTLVDEIYQFREPYSRQRLRVLMSLDTDKTDMNKRGIKRTDGDFAVSWVRTHGKGRVFYCSLGHNDHIFWNPAVMRHYLAGIQFALGDFDVPTTPSQPPAEADDDADAEATDDAPKQDQDAQPEG